MSGEYRSNLVAAISDGRLVEDFLQDCEYRKRSSKNTVESYRSDLKKFIEFIAVENKTSLTRCSREDIVAFFRSLELDGETCRTRSRRLSCLRRFFGFLKEKGRISELPTTGLRNPKIPKNLPKTLSSLEIKKLLDEGRKGDKLQRRTGIMLEVMYATGMRVSEMVGLRLEHLLLDEGVILIEKGKGSKGRTVLVPAITVKHLVEYLDEIRPLILEGGYSPWVFVSKAGNAINREYVWTLFKNLAKDAGIVKPMMPHLLRHTCATHLLENGCDLLTVQNLLGHSHISTTEIYTHVLEERKRKVFNVAHPRARRG
jgi:integrase/recombinase XerD